MTGITTLIPENELIERPKNYRPITCLPTIYKTITSIISKQIQSILMREFLCLKSRKGAVEDQKDAEIRYYYQKPYYRNVRAGRKIYNKI